MAKQSNPVVFSDDSSNALSDVFAKFAQAKANLSEQSKETKAVCESYNMDMYAEVCAIVNQCEFNSKGNLYKEDKDAIKAGIKVGLGTIRGANAKAKRLYENSVGVVRALRRDKDPLNAIPTQATPSQVREHLETQNVTTEAGMVALWKKETPREDWEKMVIKIAGELITWNDKEDKPLETPVWKGGFDADKLQQFQDFLAEQLAAAHAFADAKAAEEAKNAKAVQNDTCKGVFDALEGKAA